MHHFLQSPAKTLPALKPLLGQGTFICWLASHLKESFSQKVKVQGVRILKFSLLALIPRRTQLFKKGGEPPNPGNSSPAESCCPPAANWFCTGQDLIPLGDVKKGLGSQDISLQCRWWEELIHQLPSALCLNPSSPGCGVHPHTLPSHQNLQLDFILYIDIYVKYSYYLCK